MKPQTPLTGIHHISAMTGDAQKNVDFYTRLLGMRAVKKTVNQDSVDVYHLFYADGDGQAGTDLTFFAFPGVVKNRNQLLDVAYQEDVFVDDRTIDSHIKRIRRKFRVADPQFDAIETLYGVGYRFSDG